MKNSFMVWMQRILLSMVFLGLAFPLKAEELTIATTTSLDNTGLLEELMPVFTKDTGVKVRWVAVGTGKALALGRSCDVDVLLVHAPKAEQKEVEEGYAIERTQLMYNNFLIIGPLSDPAQIKSMAIDKALARIAEKKAAFCSRGDNSGTHKKELSLWKSFGMTALDKKDWYAETGQGMLATVRIAAEKNAYTLVDKGTYIKYTDSLQKQPSKQPPLVALVEKGDGLLNQYSALLVNPQKCSTVKAKAGRKLIQWLTTKKAQEKIRDFRLMGQQMFVPNAEPAN